MSTARAIRRPVLAIAVLVAMIAALFPSAAGAADGDRTIRFATFNASLNRATQGELISDLMTPTGTQAQNVAENPKDQTRRAADQRVRPR